MSTKTNIEWTDATWNPIRGCSRVSEGCRNCYAEKAALRFSGPGLAYEGLAHKVNGHAAWTGKVELVDKHLLDPLRWGPVLRDCDMCGAGPNDTCMHGSAVSPHSARWQPRRIFVNSMSDLFHESVPDEWIDKIFAVMALCPQHEFQILTKRPERMLKHLSERTTKRIFRDFAFKEREFAAAESVRGVILEILKIIPGQAINRAVEELDRLFPQGEGFMRGWPLRNVWLGVSVEDQKAADERIPLLLETPAAVRFISAEPLLGSVDLSLYLSVRHEDEYAERGVSVENIDQSRAAHQVGLPMHDPWVSPLDWVICGGESGPGARPMHPDWARGLRDQCAAAGVPFFFKQWGEWEINIGGGSIQPGQLWLDDAGRTSFPSSNDVGANAYCMRRVGKKAAGALLDGREWREFPSSAVRA